MLGLALGLTMGIITLALRLAVVILRHAPVVVRWRLEVSTGLIIIYVFWVWTTLIILPVAVVMCWPRIVRKLPRLRRADRFVQKLREPFIRSMTRHWFRFALRRVDLPPVRVLKMSRTPSGWEMRVAFPPGTSGWPDRFNPLIASTMRCREVRVEVAAADAGRGVVRIVTRDPLQALTGKWPWLDRERVDLRRVPVGVDENGRQVTVKVRDRHVLIGGQTGSGKSVAMSMLVAAVALSDATLYCVDGKGGVELKAWRKRSRGFGVTPEEAVGVLGEVHAEMDRRYGWLEAHDLRKMPDAAPPCVLVIDELALFTTDKKGRFGELLRDLVARGRAAGVCVIAATQKPEVKVVPSSIRDLFSDRWALSCATPQMSDTILGSGKSGEGFDASRIGRQPGVGYLFAEEGRPRRCRTYMLTDADLNAISKRIKPAATRVTDEIAADSQLASRAPVRGGEWLPPGYTTADLSLSQAQAGSATSRADLAARLSEHLNGAPVSASALARAVGRKPNDGSVRRALAQLEAGGRAVRADGGGWMRS